MHPIERMAVWLTAFSVATFVASLLALPWLVAQAPTDLFTRDEAPRSHLGRRIVRNVVGVALIACGIAMLVLPGQGLLTLLAGICLADIPGKRALLVELARRESVWRGLSYLRERAKKPPFERP